MICRKDNCANPERINMFYYQEYVMMYTHFNTEKNITIPVFLLLLPCFKMSYMTLLKNCGKENVKGYANKKMLLLLRRY